MQIQNLFPVPLTLIAITEHLLQWESHFVVTTDVCYGPWAAVVCILQDSLRVNVVNINVISTPQNIAKRLYVSCQFYVIIHISMHYHDPQCYSI